MTEQAGKIKETPYLDAMLEMAASGDKLTRCYLQCLDPVHVGEGGYRMGHVDNTVMRDKPTGLPIVPGTTLKGAARQGAFLWLAEILLRDTAASDRYQVLRQAEELCGIVFGSIDDDDSGGGLAEKKGKKQDARAGLARFYDLLPVFFPVPSLLGPVWLTSPELAQKWLGLAKQDVLHMEEGTVCPLCWEGEPLKDTIRLGWLNLEVEEKNNMLEAANRPPAPIQRLLVTGAGTFSRLVRDNMEVRTSVKIGRESGAAESGALFTYEALPRFTVLGLEVLWPEKTICSALSPACSAVKDGSQLLNTWLKRLQTLGLGGYGSKGFGRVKLLSEKEEIQGRDL